jgi:UDP-glucose 4-epimerase
MRVLVTGGAGFIGSHICDRALERGWEVAVVDDLSSGRRENVPERAAFFQVDIRDRDAVFRVLREFHPDAISHQAAQASVAVSVREPVLDTQINVIGSLNLLDACVECGVQQVVFASTGGAIYGEVPDNQKADENTPPRPLSPYAVSKFAVENHLVCYQREHGLKSTVLRYANIYGPRQDPHGEAGVVAIFCNRLMAGESLQINAKQQSGDDGCIRDYTYVDDVAKANVAALAGEVSHGVMNIGSGVPTSTRALADALEAALGTSTGRTVADRRAGDIERSVLAADRFVEMFGPATSLESGITQTAAWFSNR